MTQKMPYSFRKNYSGDEKGKRYITLQNGLKLVCCYLQIPFPKRLKWTKTEDYWSSSDSSKVQFCVVSQIPSASGENDGDGSSSTVSGSGP